MTQQEIIQHWIKSAKHDWKTVHHLFDQRDYVYALFFAHLYLEKLLKALVVQNTETRSPYGHRLRALGQQAIASLTGEQIMFLERVTAYNIAGRYDDWRFAFRKRCTRQFCENELKEIERFGKWLQKMLKP
jgi:HEPN domain-containing protein